MVNVNSSDTGAGAEGLGNRTLTQGDSGSAFEAQTGPTLSRDTGFFSEGLGNRTLTQGDSGSATESATAQTSFSGGIPFHLPDNLGLQTYPVAAGVDTLGWEVIVRSGAQGVTGSGYFGSVLAVISRYQSLEFTVELNDQGTGAITLDLDDPVFQGALADGSPVSALLDQDNLWQVFRDGQLVFEFLGETTVEQLVDPTEVRPVTISGAGTCKVLTWAQTAPPGWPNIKYKLTTLRDDLKNATIASKPNLLTWNQCFDTDGTINLVLNPGFEVDTTGWDTNASFFAQAGGALSRTTTDSSLLNGNTDSAACGYVVTDGTSGSQGANYVLNGRLLPNTPYQVTADVKWLSGRPIKLGIADTTNSVSGSSSFSSPTAWATVTASITTGATGQANAVISVVTDGTSAASQFLIDNVTVLQTGNLASHISATVDAAVIAHVNDVGTKYSNASSSRTETIPISVQAQAGDGLVLTNACRNPVNGPTIVSITDTKFNTWKVDVGPYNGYSDYVLVASTMQDKAPLGPGDSVTITYGQAPNGQRVSWISEFSGMGLFDTFAHLGSSQARQVDYTGRLSPTSAGDLLIALFCADHPYSALGITWNYAGTIGTYSAIGPPDASTESKIMGMRYQVGASAGQQEAVIKTPGSGNYNAVLAAYKPATVSPSGLGTVIAVNDITQPFSTIGAGFYDATESSLYAKIIPMPQAVNHSNCTLMTLKKDSHNYVQFQLGQSVFTGSVEYPDQNNSAWAWRAVMCQNGTVTSFTNAYDPVLNLYWRIRETAGIVFWESSPDGSSWVIFWEQPHTFDMTSVSALFQVSSTSAEAITYSATFSEVNLLADSYEPMHSFTQTPQMSMLYQLIAEIQSNLNVIPFVNQLYTGAADAAGVTWADSVTSTLANGQDFYSLLVQFATATGCDFLMRPGFNLDIQQAGSMGTDLSNTVIFHEGGSQLANQRTRMRDSIANIILVKDSVGRFKTATDRTSAASYMNRMGFLQASAPLTPQSLSTFVSSALKAVKDAVSSWTLTVDPSSSGRAIFVDYSVGDYVGVARPMNNGVDAQRVVGATISVDNSQTVTCELTLQSRIQEYDALLTRLINTLSGNLTSNAPLSSLSPGGTLSG